MSKVHSYRGIFPRLSDLLSRVLHELLETSDDSYGPLDQTKLRVVQIGVHPASLALLCKHDFIVLLAHADDVLLVH